LKALLKYKRSIFGLTFGALLILPQLAWPDDGVAFYNLKTGEDIIENVTLPTIDGDQASLLDHEKGANVFIFFRTGAEPSLRGIKDMSRCAEELAEFPIHWVGLVSDLQPVEEVRAMVDESGFKGPILIDQGNTLYGKFGVRLHPVVGVAAGNGLLTAYQAFTQVNFCARVKAYVLHTLGEIDTEELDRRLNPQSVNPRGNASTASRNLRMGERFLAAGNPEQALASAQRSLELVPGLPEAHGLAALALAHQEQCEAAAEHIAKALLGNTQEPKALEARQKCE
jgi:peroxiredoxin